MSRIRWKVDIYNQGVTATSGAIDFTLGTSQMPIPPSVGGYLVRPTLGRSESQPWVFHTADPSSSFTGQIASTAGRLNLQGRLVRVRRSLDSTASSDYTVRTVGRIEDVGLNPNPAIWDVTVSDERMIERQIRCFTALDNAVSLIPGGLVKNAPRAMLTYPPDGGVSWFGGTIGGNIVVLQYIDQRPHQPMDQSVQDFIVNDLDPDWQASWPPPNTITTGPFKHIVWRNVATGTDYPVLAFGLGVGLPSHPTAQLSEWGNALSHPMIMLVWVTSPPAAGSTLRGYVHASGAEPAPAVPLFVGGAAGLHPAELAQDLYQGTYSPAGTPTVRISTAGFAAWKADTKPGRVWFRIMGPQTMTDFLERRLFQPYLRVPVPDTSGKITPVSVALPSSSEIGPLGTLTSTNLVIHPTWNQIGRETLNAVEFHYERIRPYGAFTTASLPLPPRVADSLLTSTHSLSTQYDNTTLLGRRASTIAYGGVVDVSYSTGPESVVPVVSGIFGRLAQTYFARFGDGPLYSDVTCLESVDNSTAGRLAVGGFVKMNLATFPNPAVASRGSTRYLQIINRSEDPGLVHFRLLDLGPSVTPLAGPVLSLFHSSLSSRHGIKCIVSILPSGTRYEIRMAPQVPSTAASSPPASNSTKWRIVAIGSSANTTQHVLRLASNVRWHAQVRAIRWMSVPSAWRPSAPVNIATVKITAPSSLTATTSRWLGAAILTWNYGATGYPEEIMLSDSTADALGSSRSIARVPELTTAYAILGLNATTGTTYKAGVRHYDLYGGFSTMATVTWGSTVAAPTLDPPKGIVILQGKL